MRAKCLHTYKYMDSNFVGKAISNNTTDDVVVKADGKIGNSLSPPSSILRNLSHVLFTKKRIGDNFTIIVHIMGFCRMSTYLLTDFSFQIVSRRFHMSCTFSL